MRKIYKFKKFLFTALLVCGSSWAIAQQSVWVSSSGTSLNAEASAFSKKLAPVEKGAKLTVLEEQGKWYRVSTEKGDYGWIYRGKVSDQKPEEESGGLFGALDGGITADTADTSRSIRGLSPEAEEYAKATGAPEENKKALDAVLEIKISDKEIAEFLKKEKIGEYAN